MDLHRIPTGAGRLIGGRRGPSAAAAAVVFGALAVIGAGVPGGDAFVAKAVTTTTTTTAPGRFPVLVPKGLRSVRKREEKAAPPPQTAPTKPVGPAAMGTTTMTFVDSSRPTPARGNQPASHSRTLVTTIYYPTSSASSSPPPAARGPFPLIVFADGYEIDAAAYSLLLGDLASGGFAVVAAPDFPLTSTAHPGSGVRSDMVNQPGDMSFVITSMLSVSVTLGGLLSGTINPAVVGVSGQSDGAITAGAVGYNTCCLDPRVKAGALLSGCCRQLRRVVPARYTAAGSRDADRGRAQP